LLLAGTHSWGAGSSFTGGGTLAVTAGLSSFNDLVFSGDVAVSGSGSLSFATPASIGGFK
jgi:hypothetical protein